MPTTPPVIDALPSPPDPNNRATFNALAYPWSVAQQTLAEQVGDVADNVHANAVEAAAAAATALSKSAEASASAASSSNSASVAAASAATAVAAVNSLNLQTVVAMNPRAITANLVVPSGYNAASVGPITIADGVTVTVQDNASWSIQ